MFVCGCLCIWSYLKYLKSQNEKHGQTRKLHSENSATHKKKGLNPQSRVLVLPGHTLFFPRAAVLKSREFMTRKPRKAEKPKFRH